MHNAKNKFLNILKSLKECVKFFSTLVRVRSILTLVYHAGTVISVQL